MAECSRHPGNPLPGCHYCRTGTEPGMTIPVTVLTGDQVEKVFQGAAVAVFLRGVTAVAESEIVHPDDECDPASCTPHGALRMSAAIKALLKLADSWDEMAAWSRLHGLPAEIGARAIELRRTIARELLGEGDDGS